MNRRLFIDGVYMIIGVLTIEYIFNRVIIEEEEEDEGDDCIIS
tara:strand:- start:392 stop:520 length:129 start_codon:yes stop_codon:yes gene_type:complete